MSMNCVIKHSQNHADSEYISYLGVDCKEVVLIGNKLTYKHSTLHISTGKFLLLLTLHMNKRLPGPGNVSV